MSHAYMFLGVSLIAFIASIAQNSSLFTFDTSAAENWDPKPTQLEKNRIFIQFCDSWAYRGTFNQVASHIQQRCVTNVEIQGGNYPPPPHLEKLAELLSYIQMALIIFILLGDKIASHLEIELPEPIKNMFQNKIAFVMVLWLVGNTLTQNLVSTKAFEIYYEHTKIWSSIKMERLPTLQDLFRELGKVGVDCIQKEAVSRR